MEACAREGLKIDVGSDGTEKGWNRENEERLAFFFRKELHGILLQTLS